MFGPSFVMNRNSPAFHALIQSHVQLFACSEITGRIFDGFDGINFAVIGPRKEAQSILPIVVLIVARDSKLNSQFIELLRDMV